MNWKYRITAVIAWSMLLVAPVRSDVMVGAFVAGNAWDETAITGLNEQLPKSMSFINVFSSFSENWDHLYWQSSKIVDQGMMPMISWMPIDSSRYDDNILPEIALGSWDTYIDLWGEKLVDWVNAYPENNRPAVMLRFGHEFNGSWYSYGDAPEWYIAAWQHIHDRFESAGVNEHIEWVWNANNVNVDSYNDITRYYPGDNYVDWTSIDGYNWGSNYAWTTWDSFTEVFSPVYSTLVTNYPDKPIIIAEVGSTDPAETPNAAWGQNGDDSDYAQDKDIWTSDMLLSIENEFPAIRAIALFNIDKELRWSLTEPSSTGLQGYISALQSPHFTSEYIELATDDTPPIVNLTYPMGIVSQSGNLDISGVFEDDISGVAKIRVSVDRYDSSPRQYWQGNSRSWSQTPSSKWNTATIEQDSGKWYFNNVDLSANGNYRVRLYAVDQAGNATTIIPEFINVSDFNTVDSTAPEADTTYPANTIAPSSHYSIQGTVTDDQSGVQKVKVSIDRYQGNKRIYWNGTENGWTTSTDWHLASLSNESEKWTLDGIDLSTPGHYRIRLYVIDQAGNTDLFTTKNFTVTALDTLQPITDTTPPTATTSFPVNTISPDNNAKIHGSSIDDNSGVKRVKVSIDLFENDKSTYWNGNTWTTSKYWNTADLNQETGSWTLDNVDLSQPGYYRIRLYVVDHSGNANLFTTNTLYVALDVSAEAYIRDIASESADDLAWVYDLLAPVTLTPLSPVVTTAVQSGETLKQEVKALVREQAEIVKLEAEVSELELTGSAKDLEKAVKHLARVRSSYNARKERLLDKKQRQIEKQANPEKVLKYKKFDRSKQRLRAVSKPLPPVNITKRDRLRNGFKSMSTDQREQFKAMKRSVLD